MAKLPTSFVAYQNPPDTNEIVRFLKALDPDANNFLFYAIKPGSHPQVTRQPLMQEVLDSFAHWNGQGYNIYVTVNEVNNGAGTSRSNESISKFRCVYADDDGKAVAQPYPLPPSAIIESSPGKKQVYWFIDGCPDLASYDGVQQTIVNYYGGDANARDAARILRLPGLFNTKPEYTDSPKAKILELAGHRYSWDQITQAFPPSEVVRPTGQPVGEGLDLRLTLEQFITGQNYHEAGIALAGFYYNNGIRNRDKLVGHLQALIDIQGDVNDDRFQQRRDEDIPNSVDWIIKKREQEEAALVTPQNFFEDDKDAQEYTSLPMPGGAMWYIVQWVRSMMRYPNDTIAIIVAEHLVSTFGGGHYCLFKNTTTRKRIMLAPMGSGKNTVVVAQSALVAGLESLNAQNMPYLVNAEKYIGSDAFSFSTQHKQLEEHRVRSFIVNEAGESGKSKSGDLDNLRAYQLQALSTKAGGAIYPKKFSEQGKFDDSKQVQTLFSPVLVYLHESTLSSYASLLQDSGAFVNGDMSRSDVFFIDPTITETNPEIELAVPVHIVRMFAAMAMPFQTSGSVSGVLNNPSWEEIDISSIRDDLVELERSIVAQRNTAYKEKDEVQIAQLGRKFERILTTVLVLAIADAAIGEQGIMTFPKAERHHLQYAIARDAAIDESMRYHTRQGGVLNDNHFEQAEQQFKDKFQDLIKDKKKRAALLKEVLPSSDSSVRHWMMTSTAYTRMLQRGPYQKLVEDVYRGDRHRAKTAFVEHLIGLDYIKPVKVETQVGADIKVSIDKHKWYLNPRMFPVE